METPELITRHYAAHIQTLQNTWEQALQAENFDSVVVHAGSPLVSFLDDFHYNFRPNPHFLAWLPLTHHPESVLIFQPGARPVLYFYQPTDFWHRAPDDPEPWWAEHFDIRVMREPGHWRQGVPVGREAYIGDAPELEGDDDHNPARLLNRLHLARTRKTAYELACMRESSRVAAGCHRAAEQAFREGRSEYGIHMAYLEAGRLTEADLPYGSIVALNRHAAVLHYQNQERRAPETSRSFLIDAGATFHAYCSDITRTYAAEEGAFGALVAGMDALQQKLAGAMRAGVDYRDLHLQTHQGVAGLLVEHDIVHMNAEDVVASGLSAAFFPHGLGHFIGLQTHDVAGLIEDATGREIPRPAGHPFLRLTRKLEAGNVVTVEPGLYFIDSLLEPWRHGRDRQQVNWDVVDALAPYGGVRIEDDVVVTADEPENLSREAFAALD
jgi:Xaa-Pro dipeptidase